MTGSELRSRSDRVDAKAIASRDGLLADRRTALLRQAAILNERWFDKPHAFDLPLGRDRIVIRTDC